MPVVFTTMAGMVNMFNPAVYSRRLTLAREACKQQGIAAAIFATGPDFAYFTGSWASSHERLTALVVPAHGRPFIVVPATDAGDLKLSAVPELDIEVVTWRDGETPSAYTVLAENIGRAETHARVAISESLDAGHVLELNEVLPQARWVSAQKTLQSILTVKDAAEIEQLAAAGVAIDAVHARVPALLRAGRTEAEVAEDIRELILREHSEVDFIIVGSGPNGAHPHHDYSDRVLADGDIVVVDIGGTYGAGYHSDCTRTYRVGGVTSPAQIPHAYTVLLEAQAAAVDAVRPGVTAASIDKVARDVLAAAGYGEFFTHRLGHGIGLSTHEQPFIMPGNDIVLEPGMAFSIEPGVYFPDQWGARIEDIVVVTEDGARRLNNQPRELV